MIMLRDVKPRLNELLKERGWTQMQLSEKSGVPQGTISRFDKTSQGKYLMLFLLANALEVSIEDLFEKIDADIAAD